MVTSRREKARRIVIAYMVIGFVFLILYHFILRPADPDNPLVIALFYFFLPAILLAAGGLLDIILEELSGVLNRFREKDEEIQDEDAGA